MMKLYIISIFTMFVLACNKNVTPQETVAPKVEESTSKKALPECMTEVATVGEVLAQEGTVVKVTDQLMIAFGTSSRCIPCNMPSDIKEGDRVSFSGNIKQPPAGVRMAGTPICLIIIEKI